jgi:hypothetical protein
MAIYEVPPYLIRSVRDTAPEAVGERLADGGESLPDLLAEARDTLDRWSDDFEFWQAVEESYRSTTLDGNVEVESQILAEALGDRRLADTILLEAPTAVSKPQLAVQAVIVIRHQCGQVLEQPPSRGRLYRAGKVLRRVFKAVGGGVLVAADIVAPDPTMLVKVASIWGGLDMIIDAAED